MSRTVPKGNLVPDRAFASAQSSLSPPLPDAAFDDALHIAVLPEAIAAVLGDLPLNPMQAAALPYLLHGKPANGFKETHHQFILIISALACLALNTTPPMI